jgi:phosphoribosyl-AMP cyclohydrolase
MELLAIETGDARRFLPAMLERVQPQRDDGCRRFGFGHTENAAFLAKLVVVERMRCVQIGGPLSLPGGVPIDAASALVSLLSREMRQTMDDRETGLALDPKWDANGLITGVVSDAKTGALLMVAHLNAEALALTRSTGEAHFWSRSRGRIWKKGEESGNVLHVVELRIDCDQDALWIRADPAGPACHTGTPGCFYRRIEDGRLVRD